MPRIYCWFLLLCTLSTQTVSGQETLRVMAYNLLNFPDPVPAGRADTFANIASYAAPDLLLVCELKTASGADQLLNKGLNVDGTTNWRRADFVPDGSLGGDLQTLVYYRQNKLALYSQQPIRTNLRDISRYVFFFRDPFLAGHQDTTWLDVYVAHLKAGNTPSDQSIRSRMVDSLRRFLDEQPPGRSVILGGDFNTYTSSEPAYQKLTDPYAPIWLRDPINRPGSWSSNASMTEVHTQSTRTSAIFGDGSGGGMDDRFDFLLVSSPILFGSGRIGYVSGSYKALGNPGGCLNANVLSCEPNPVPRKVRSSLFYMSDHLPVIIDLQITYPVFNGISQTVQSLKDISAWWDGNQIHCTLPIGQAGTLTAYDLDGRILAQKIIKAPSSDQAAILELADYHPSLIVIQFRPNIGQSISQLLSIQP